jgi:hypothetical protein
MNKVDRRIIYMLKPIMAFLKQIDAVFMLYIYIYSYSFRAVLYVLWRCSLYRTTWNILGDFHACMRSDPSKGDIYIYNLFIYTTATVLQRSKQ